MLMFAAFPGEDFNFTVETKLHFTDFNANRSQSKQIVIPILNDDVAEPRESFVCTMNTGEANKYKILYPSQVLIKISDDDGEYPS